MNSNQIARAACGMPQDCEAFARWRDREPPRCPSWLYEFECTINGVDLVCHIEYEKACRGTRENGVPVEPDHEANATLCAAYVRDIDVTGLLDDDQRQEIEQAFLDQGNES